MRILHSKKEMFALFLPGFLLGILYVNFIVKQYIAEPGIFSTYVMRQYASVEIIAGEYMLYLVRVRLLPAVFLAGMSFTKLRKLSAAGFLLWTGFSSGMLLTMAVIGMGVKGIFLCIVGILPHFLCYIPAGIVVLWYCWMYPQNRWNRQKTVFVVLMLLMGLILEAYVNPVWMKAFLGIL